MDNRRIKDLATLLPWAGLFLFTPPVLFLFHPTTTIYGVPLLPIYLFATWLILIIISRKITKHLVDEVPSPRSSMQDEPKRFSTNSSDGA